MIGCSWDRLALREVNANAVERVLNSKMRSAHERASLFTAKRDQYD